MIHYTFIPTMKELESTWSRAFIANAKLNKLARTGRCQIASHAWRYIARDVLSVAWHSLILL
jgi:hypothetical protein